MAPGRRLFCGAEPPTSTPHCTLCPQEWLSRFGYLPPADPETGQLQTPEELSKAIVAMQRFGGLEATGVLGGPDIAGGLGLVPPGPVQGARGTGLESVPALGGLLGIPGSG
eukprot:bmy_20542T0